MVDNHLSRLETPETVQKHHLHIDDTFPGEQTLTLSHDETLPWFADIANYLSIDITQPDLTYQQKKRSFVEVKYYFWEDPILFKQCVDQIIRRCVPESKVSEILTHCHSLECGGHFNGQGTSAKVLQSGFYWVFIGLLYSKMHTHLQSPMIYVKGPRTLDDEVKSH